MSSGSSSVPERVGELVEEGPHGLGDPDRELVPAEPRDGLATAR